MLILTKAQRKALKAVFDRCELYTDSSGKSVPWEFSLDVRNCGPLSYREFRKRAVQFDYDAIGIQWCGMWLGIETDGYTHS